MKFPRRTFLHFAAGAAALPALSQIARAQAGSARPKIGTRVITLGTAAGPALGRLADRAQSSNLLIVDGTFYVVDAGDGAARRITKAGLMSEILEPFSSPIFMTTTWRGLER
jgi:hypothetical protein